MAVPEAPMPDAPPAPEDFALLAPLRVRWAECDPQGIVFNPRYFEYFDVAVTEHSRAIGFPYPEGLHAFGTDLFTVHASADWRASARFDDALAVGCRAAALGRTSPRYALCVFRGERPLVSGTLVYVNARLSDRAPAPLPEPFVEKLVAFERIPPTRK